MTKADGGLNARLGCRAIGFAGLAVASKLKAKLVNYPAGQSRSQRAGKSRRFRDAVSRVFLDAQWSAIFVVVAGKVFLFESQHSLVRAVHTNVLLEHLNILSTPHLLHAHLACQ